mgnify:CR=1 FL=1
MDQQPAVIRVGELDFPARKVWMRTYGCQMNEHDSYQMRGVLEQQGYEITDDQDAASLIVVNTCSVRHNPENKVYSLVGTLRDRKKAEQIGRAHV